MRDDGPVRVGVVILPEHRWREGGSDRWRRAESLGFDHAWTYDHLAWRDLRDSPWFDATATLAAAATATSRIRLGTLVASPNFRHPVPLARQVLTLDDVSGGRFVLGLGAGGQGWDASMLGQTPWSPAERAGRFAEFVELLDRLLTDPEVSYTGTYYSAVEARSHPGCVQQPRVPFTVAATGPRGMEIAARFAGTWVTTGDRSRVTAASAKEGAVEVDRQMRMLDDACARVGRDPSTVGRMVLTGLSLDSGLTSRAALEDTIGAYEAVGVTDFVVHWPRPTAPYRGSEDDFASVVGGYLRDRVDENRHMSVKTAGIRHIHLLVADLDRAIQFYGAAFGMEETFRDGEDLVFLNTPGTHDSLALHLARDDERTGTSGGYEHFGITVVDRDALDEAIAAVVAAGGALVERGEHAPGVPYAYVSDPDGYVIEI